MLAVASVFVIAVTSLLITRIATLALVLTGMSQESARFQARSALSGTGFTTAEAEGVVGHPVRRRIVMTLMLLGGAGLVTTMATLVIGFASASRTQAFARLGVLILALGALVAISRTRWFNRALSPLLARLLNRYTDLDAKDYAELLHLGGEWGVGEIAVREGDWLAGARLAEHDLRSEGVAALGVERPDGSFLGAPSFQTLIRPGDVLLLYGRRDRLDELDDRCTGPEGNRAHLDAVADQERRSAEERAEDDRAIGTVAG
ncbi:TrkA C-terminal domain-containing protein [soil metagenome]